MRQPFRHPVIALGCAAILVSGCSGPARRELEPSSAAAITIQSKRQLEGPVLPPEPLQSPEALRQEPSCASAEAPSDPESGPCDAKGGDPRAPSVAVGSQDVEVTTEPVQYEGMRRRPTGAVAGAVADEELQVWNVGGRTDSSHISNRPGYHPGTRVRVDAKPGLSAKFLRSTAGAKFARQLTAALRNQGYWPFRNCYEDNARHRPDPGGKTQLRLTADGGGNIRQSRLIQTDLKQRSIAACHAIVARDLRLAPSRFRRLDIDVTVSVWPGDVPLLPLPRQLGAAGSAEKMGTMDAQIGRIHSEVVGCMRGARQKDPLIWGRLCLAFGLDANGHVQDLAEHQSAFGDPSTVGCVVRLVEGLEFPAAETQLGRFSVAWRLLPAATIALNRESSVK